MKSTIRLFKAVVIKSKRKKNPTKELLEKTVKRGFIFSPEVIFNYSTEELDKLINIIEKEIGLTAEQMNSSFHKSWNKIKTASMQQLVTEQLVHYFTTYGFEQLGIYDKDSVYIPNEKLEIPELKEDINLTIIKGYTKKEIKDKLLSLLQTGIALGEDTMEDIKDIFELVKIKENEIEQIKNKEVKITLYDLFKIIPENPIEFLRYVVYKSTEKTLLIKNKYTIEKIKSEKNLFNIILFKKYAKKYGLKNLSTIFYRYKPIFLAFKIDKQINAIINKIRKLAADNHQPMKEDYLNTVTSKIKNKEQIDIVVLNDKLNSVNTFRKIRLAYALKFRTKNPESILYRVRNGKSYATEFCFDNKNKAKEILDIVLKSIIKDIEKNVKGKKIYVPENIVYTLPATEKQFTGDFPSGSYITVDKDMIVGVYWKDVKNHRIDLDLSMVNDNGKIGWDNLYRTRDGDVLFSGDVTSAPNGASELFYVRRQSRNSYILFINYYNYDKDIEVPFKIMVGKEQVKNLSNNYIMNPNNVIAIAKTKINQTQKILGLLVTTTNNCRFYFAEAYLGKSIISSGSKFVENSRKYLLDYYTNTISLNEILEKAGCEFVEDKTKCDIDLSLENLEKDKIINLLK